jgi:5-methylcytosine-specific restriction enzyme subunit McrC
VSDVEPIVVGEYQRHTRPAPPPTDADQRLAKALAAGGGENARLDVRWLANGDVDIRATSWVGVVHFSSLRVSVVPKLVGGALQVLRMLEYATGVNVLSRLPADRPRPPGGDDLFDLICLLLTEQAQALTRDGLLRDYRSTTDTLDVLRGRLRHKDQLLREYGQLTRLHCQYDEYDTDTPDNQLVGAALHVARRQATDPSIRFAALRLAGIFDEACTPPTDRPDFYRHAISYNRRNEHYRPGHELAALVLLGIAFQDMFETTSGRVSAFMIDMNPLFERFMTRLVDEALQPPSPLRSRSQVPLGAVIRDDNAGKTYTTLQPDLIIEDTRTGRQVPVDIKYKRYDIRKVDPADIYQTFMYAFALGTSDERRAGIIYPSEAQSVGPALSVRPLTGSTAARIAGAAIDVPSTLDDLTGPRRRSVLQRLHGTLDAVMGAGAS